MFRKILYTLLGLFMTSAALAVAIPNVSSPVEVSQIQSVLNGLVASINSGSSGILAANVTPVSTTTGTTIQTLQSYTLPAGYLTRVGQTVHARCAGVTAANANVKTMTLAFGSSAIATPGAATNAGTWSLDIWATKSGASTQAIDSGGVVVTTPVAPFVTAGANTDTAAIVIACSGTDGTSSAGDITANSMIVEVSQ